MAHRITRIAAREILDSRGRPTVDVHLELEGGATGDAAVPSGVSRGRREAHERRDGGHRYGGLGVRNVVAAIEGEITEALVGPAWGSLADLDHALCALDGTPTKRRLGGNAIVGVSMAAARAFAASEGLELFDWLPGRFDGRRLPVPHFNIVNGGAHAKNRLAFQEFMVAPLGADTFGDALRAGAEIYGQLISLVDRLGLPTGVGDEGGVALQMQAPEDVLDLLVESITKSGYEARVGGVAIALDLAATGFRAADGRYLINGVHFDSTEFTEYLSSLVDRYPIWSIEDAMGEDDDEGWAVLTEALGSRIQLVGDDNLVTNPDLISSAIADRRGTAALIKVNQIGTVTETLEALSRCCEGGFGAMISHRSGETNDTFISDLSVAAGCGQIKAGAPARGERVVKYNRLLEIEAMADDFPYGLP